MVNSHILKVAGLIALSLTFSACAKQSSTTAAKPLLASAGSITFNDANVLFIGDSKAGKVHAFELTEKSFDEQSGYKLGRAQTFEGRTIIDGIDRKIAALLGVSADDVEINDMVVHKPSKQIFLSVHRGRGPNAEALILKVDKGELKVLELSQIAHTSQSIGPVPTKDTLEFGQPLNKLSITDIDYYKGELFVAGVSNEEFSSKMRRMAYPFTDHVSTSSIEIWHAVHAQYETRAPIITQTITELNGKPTLVAIYACTPIVRIPLESLKDGARVRGEMIGEMGFGNTPIDIVEYVNGWDKSKNMIVTNTNRSAMQVPLDAIAKAELMPHGEGIKPVFSVSGVTQYPMPLGGTLHLDTADSNWAVVIRRSLENPVNMQLHSIPLPFFFDRADHIVEMNWADGPDPFGYKAAPPIIYEDE